MGILDKIWGIRPPPSRISWGLPPSDILGVPTPLPVTSPVEPILLELALENFGFSASVSQPYPGPSHTLFEVTPKGTVGLSKLKSILPDLAIRLGLHGLSMTGHIPGTSTVGLEVPTPDPITVPLSLFSKELARKKIPLPIGIGDRGEPVTWDLADAPHLLVAGTTGSGKSVFINSFIASCLVEHTPDDLQFILIDPKMVEFQQFRGIPHLLMDVISEVSEAVQALYVLERFMDERFAELAKAQCSDIEQYNKTTNTPMNRIVIVIDEFADLIMQNPLVENPVVRIAQKARAAGIHLVIATQRPIVKVVTGLIKANISCRIGLRVPSGIDSRVILDRKGAEKLRGAGDLLALKGSTLLHAQAPIVDKEITQQLVSHWRK